MNPALITSARPLTYSAAGSDSSTARSASTPAGGWKAPTRFLPASMFTAVLPPTAASTTASRVVGTRISRTPRSQVAATNPARSVVAPPPTPTMASLRVSRCAGQPGPQIRRHGDRLGRLAGRHLLAVHRVPGAGQHPAHRARDLAQPFGMHNDDRAGRLPDERGQFGEHARADDHLVGVLAVDLRSG